MTAADVLAELRGWIEVSWDPELSLVRWRELLADAGWACPAWPHGWCGRSLPAGVAALVTAELAGAGVPGPAEGVGVGRAGPVLIEHGTDALLERFVRRTVTGEITWCQLFSEPGGGPTARAGRLAGQAGQQRHRPAGGAGTRLDRRAARHADRLVASLAKAYCSEAYFHVAASNIQVQGGIGFTWEHDAHLYYRRAKSAEVMLGTTASHREVAAGLLLNDAAG